MHQIKTNAQMKIGIITMHRILNYGSVLQAYALQKALSKLNYESEIIDYAFPPKRQRCGIFSHWQNCPHLSCGPGKSRNSPSGSGGAAPQKTGADRRPT